MTSRIMVDGTRARTLALALILQKKPAAAVALLGATKLAPGDDVSVGWVITAAFIAEHAMTNARTAGMNTCAGLRRPRVARSAASPGGSARVRAADSSARNHGSPCRSNIWRGWQTKQLAHNSSLSFVLSDFDA